MPLCYLCPRECGVDRSLKYGYCSEGEDLQISKIMFHHWEEPCISGNESDVGSGAVFFSGCSLKCVFCQNMAISRGGVGEIVSPQRLSEEFLKLQEKGAFNINLVTPTHFTLRIIEALDLIKEDLRIPVVWNTSGYEKPETVRLLSGYVDIFLTDFKYLSPELSKEYSSSSDYGKYALESLSEMVRITGMPTLGDNGIMKKGTILRHLVLPGAYKDSIDILQTVASVLGADSVLLSLMSQYTPDFLEGDFPQINRRITTFEYEKVLRCAEDLGFMGYMQSKSSASSSYTPDF